MTKVDTKIEFCSKEEEALLILGKEQITNIYNKIKSESNVCACCGFIPNEFQNLKLHILDFSIETTNATLLCGACFLLKHFEKAIERNCVVLANSEYSQLDLFTIQRKSNKTTNNEIVKKRIVILKTTAKEYADQIKNNKLLYSPYIKVLFNNNFKWDYCK